MRKLKYSISRNALNQMYMSFLLPVVENASVEWDGCYYWRNNETTFKWSSLDSR